MSITLGGLIKNFRLQKNLSQLEVSFALGWKEPSRLSRIEQGVNRNPPRLLINDIIEAMKLSEEEKNEVLIAGNYLPSEKEITSAQKKAHRLLKEWPFPAYVMDYSWRVIYMNQKMYELYEIPAKIQEAIENTQPNLIDLLFQSKFSISQLQQEDFLLKVLIEFQYEQKERTKETWYKDLIRRNMRNEMFKDLWVKSQKTRLEYNFTTPILQNVSKMKEKRRKHLNFYIFPIKISEDPRFHIISLSPANSQTFKYGGNFIKAN